MARETEEMELDPNTVDQGVRAVFEHPERGRYWVAEQGDELVACLLTLPEWSDWRNATVLWIHSVFVIPSARRLGAFRKLYDGLQDLVRGDPGLCGLRLYVDHRNERAKEAYRAMGMSDQHYALFEWLES